MRAAHSVPGLAGLDQGNGCVRRVKARLWQALQVWGGEDGQNRVCGDGVDGVFEVESLGAVVEGVKKRDGDMARMFKGL